MADQFVYGVHAVMAVLANRHRVTKALYLTQDRVDKRVQDVLELAERAQIYVFQIVHIKELSRWPQACQTTVSMT